MEKDILDFTDYAQPLDFKFKDGHYRIPAFNKNQIEKLMTINKKFTEVGDPDPDEKKDADTIDKSGEYFDMQDEFLACALYKKTGDEFKPIEQDELKDWPIKVKNKVMKSVSDQMTTTIEEDEPEKKS